MSPEMYLGLPESIKNLVKKGEEEIDPKTVLYFVIRKSGYTLEQLQSKSRVVPLPEWRQCYFWLYRKLLETAGHVEQQTPEVHNKNDIKTRKKKYLNSLYTADLIATSNKTSRLICRNRSMENLGAKAYEIRIYGNKAFKKNAYKLLEELKKELDGMDNTPIFVDKRPKKESIQNR